MIFLDLTKAYDALDRSRCLDILEGYGVGPSAMRLLKTYWRRLNMVARAGGYYRETFKGDRGVTQGDPLSPIIFNVVVDAVVRHWIDGIGGRDCRKVRDRKGGTTPVGGVLRQRRYGHLVGPRLDPGRFQRPGSHLRQGRPTDKR